MVAIPVAPVLNIDPRGISCSGISSGADFSVQFATAFSRHIRGVGVFAGQPFHCAATRFPLDQTFPCNETQPGWHGPVGPAGCQTDPLVLPSEPASPPGEGLLWDHCKGCTPESLLQLVKHPDLVQLATLEQYARASARAGLIDDVGNLSSTRAFIYRGTKDSCYTHGVMAQTAQWFASFAKNASEQVRFVDDVPSLHAIPTLRTGTVCGTELHGADAYNPGAMHGLEACGFDGPGEALRHIYGDLTLPANASAIDPQRVIAFDQSPFGMSGASSRDMAFARAGYMYVPRRCEQRSSGAGNGSKPCRLHVFFHGCGSAFNSGAEHGHGYGFNDTFISHAGFSAWGEANDIVVLYAPPSLRTNRLPLRRTPQRDGATTDPTRRHWRPSAHPTQPFLPQGRTARHVGRSLLADLDVVVWFTRVSCGLRVAGIRRKMRRKRRAGTVTAGVVHSGRPSMAGRWQPCGAWSATSRAV